MVFNLKTDIVLNKVFTVEAEELKDAMELVQNQLIKEVDLNSLEITKIGFDLNDPSILEYNRKKGQEIIKKYRQSEE